MIIEQRYVIPANAISLERLSELDTWCQNNVSEYSIDLDSQGQNSLTVGIFISAYHHRTRITLKFNNQEDVNYFRLLFGSDFDRFLIAESIEY